MLLPLGFPSHQPTELTTLTFVPAIPRKLPSQHLEQLVADTLTLCFLTLNHMFLERSNHFLFTPVPSPSSVVHRVDAQ